MSPVAKTLALVAAAIALVGVVAIAVVTAVAVVASDDGLDFLAIPILAIGIVLVIATLLVFAVIFQGIRSLREEADEPL